MFQPTDQSTRVSELPAGCSFAESDWHILAGFWHPVAFAHEVTDRPVAARLLDVDLVVYRTGDGVTVARDLCPHRGTRLSAGALRDDMLVCPMHGLHFDGTGTCRRIPSMVNPEAPMAAKIRLHVHQSAEHLGLIWACLKDQPIWPLPEWAGLSDPALKTVYVPSDTWHAAASRHVENFNDVAHFPFVHLGSFGDADSAVFPAYQVTQTDYGLSFAVDYTEGGNRFPDDVKADRREVRYTYELTYPFSTLLIVDPAGSDFVHYFADTVCPVSARETRIFQQLTDTTGDPDADYWIKDSLTINDEDKPLVENQRPEDLPLDTAVEMHIPADRFSLAYRKALATKFGLGAPLAA